jgi:acetyl-CoA carboxylase carboxyl transferase subunit beta
MIDMVVHRHKLRETLGRLCRLMTGNSIGNIATKPVAAERGYLNGSAVDGRTIETLARAPDVDPEPVEDGERFETRQTGKLTTRDGARN